MKTAFILICAWVLDALLGDPEGLPHPVRWIGSLIAKAEDSARAWFKNKKTAGVMIGIVVPCTVYLCGLVCLELFEAISPVLEFLAEVVVVFYCLSTRCLADEANGILQQLQQHDLDAARQRLARIVGRDTAHLPEHEIVRATIESVSENTVDGVIAPLFYTALGGPALCLAYKAVNTLDSMIGYKNERYRDLGWFSARLDDIANFIPARLSLIIIPVAVLLYNPSRALTALRIGIRDGRHSPSPNAGNPEACYAGALGIQLGGSCSYNGVPSDKPLIGDCEKGIERDDIARSVKLLWRSSVCGLLFFAMLC
jgi:adenosylcobinamide-phosphate synthase